MYVGSLDVNNTKLIEKFGVNYSFEGIEQNIEHDERYYVYS